MVALEISEGIASGIITLTMVCMGEAPMLRDISMILGFSSRRLLSTNRATKGKAAMVNGTMEASVPTAVPMMALVNGNRRIIKIKNGTERRRLMITFNVFISQPGRGASPFFSPTTRRTPRGSPSSTAKNMAATVTYSVSQKASANCPFTISIVS